MNARIKVSVIVPIYNQEKYLCQCVDSICTQTLRKIEVILVDDGSTDNSPAICDKYAAKDSRVRVIHKKNEGMGVAYNVGMIAAKGEYIGFVESDDWIAPEMYEELYTKAAEQDVDVVKSFFYTNDGDSVSIPSKASIQPRSWSKRITNMLEISGYMYGHASIWSAIYRRDFLMKNNVTFPITPGASFQDMVFNWLVFCKMKSCYVLPKMFYNYRVGLPTQSINQGYKAAKMVLDVHNQIRQQIKRDNVEPRLIEIYMKYLYVGFRNSWKSKDRLHGWYRRYRFARSISLIASDFIGQVRLTQLIEKEKEEFCRLISSPLFFSLLFLKESIIKKESSPTEESVCFFGIPLYGKKKTQKKSKTYFLGIPYFSTERKGTQIIKRFMGVCYAKETVIEARDSQDVRMLQILTHANAITNTHRETFIKYKNCHQGKDVALFATGSTLNFFEPLNNCIHVGVNSAVGYTKVHLDYIFFQDMAHPYAKEILEMIGNYKGAKKFYGFLLETIREDWIVPESVAIRDAAERYYLFSQWKYPPVHYPYDIANEPLGDCGSISFAAMQFILWTNPRRIYLVGQDCSADYFDGAVSFTKLPAINNLLCGWREMKKFACVYYPSTEIISINPVGLKGMFKDMYTRSYLAKHPEIKVGDDKIIKED